jgi:two-component system, OmpR family, phosphate regulon response regulator OmpR
MPAYLTAQRWPMIPEASKSASKNPPLPYRKVLLVDEDAKDLQCYAAILQGHGHEVRVVPSYAEGWLALEKEHFDFVILSQGNREFEGRVVLQHAVEIDRHLPVLVLTDCLDMSCYLEAMQLGAADYLEKPVLPSELVRLIETHIRPYRIAGRTAGAA